MESFFVFWIKCSAVSQFSILPQRIKKISNLESICGYW